MDISFSTKNAYFDSYVDRLLKPANDEYVMMEPKGRRLYWNLRFNYPGTYNLRIQLFMPQNHLHKKSLEAGFWGSNETKQLQRYNLNNIYNNDNTKQLVWYDIGSYTIEKIGLKCFYLEKLRYGNSFGVVKICFEYCENGTEELVQPPDVNTNLNTNLNTNSSNYINTNTNTNKSLHDKIIEELKIYHRDHKMLKSISDISINYDNYTLTNPNEMNNKMNNEMNNEMCNEYMIGLNDEMNQYDTGKCVTTKLLFNPKDYETNLNSIYYQDLYEVDEEIVPPSKLHIRTLLPKGVSAMIEEVVPKTDEECKKLYYAHPAFLLSQVTENEDNDNIGGIYRELKITKHVNFTYYSFAFMGGHIGLVLDGKNGYLKMEIEPSSGKCSIIDKNPLTIVKENGKTDLHFNYEFREGINYKLFIRIKYMQLNSNEHTVYYCYFGQVNHKSWKFVGAVARPGKHILNTVSTTIENISSVNGHLYTRRVASGNTWVFDKNKNGKLLTKLTVLAKDPHNFTSKQYKNNRVELQIGSRYSEEKNTKTEYDISVTGKEICPVVPWESVDLFE